MTGPRLDHELVRRGLARSRTQAQALVREGQVRVGGQVVTKPGYAVAPDQKVSVHADVDAEGETRWISRGWVGRGAVKLDHALTEWAPSGLDVAGRRCLDIGASTGGFTQVLLERGARQVVALDVGHDQLAPSLAAHPAVTDLSGTHVRELSPELLDGPVDVVVCDVSFISLRLVLAPARAVCTPGADLVLLVKPQFEVGRGRLASTGVVRSPTLRLQVLRNVVGAAAATGLDCRDVITSPVTGGSGNVEYLVWARPLAAGMMGPDRDAAARLDARLVALTQEEGR